MKTIDKDELYQNLSEFLKSKGIELKDGTYPQRVRQGCNLLTDAINATQKTVKRTKVEVDKKLDQLRQSIHKATAPKPPAASPAVKSAPVGESAPGSKKGRKPRKNSASRAKEHRRK